ncbi:unnamed protein product [Urochloa humidicola]
MDAVKAILMDMFEAGIETTHLVLDYAMAELIYDQQARDDPPAGRSKEVYSYFYCRGKEKIRRRQHAAGNGRGA